MPGKEWRRIQGGHARQVELIRTLLAIIGFGIFFTVTLYIIRGSTSWKKSDGGPHLIDNDLVVAIPSDTSRLILIQAGQHYRQGLRTVVALNDTINGKAYIQEELLQFVVYPDEHARHGNLYVGDPRAAMVPLLAHKALKGEYKWMLYGDDDTIFFQRAVRELLKKFDPNLPYLISDNYWWYDATTGVGDQGFMGVPRCLPCHIADGDNRLRNITIKQWGFPAPFGCPCTSTLLCQTDMRGLFSHDCSEPEIPGPRRAFSIHGGAGAILSRGLLNQLDPEEFEKCVLSTHSTGGDAFLTQCAWRQGFAPTDPGISLNGRNVRAFDPGQPAGKAGWRQGSYELAQNLTLALTGKCEEACEEIIKNIVSTHIHVRDKGVDAAVQQMVLLPYLHEWWRRRIAGHPEQDIRRKIVDLRQGMASKSL